MRTRPLVSAFIGAGSMWGGPRLAPSPSLAGRRLVPPPSSSSSSLSGHRSSSRLVRMSVDPAVLEAGLTPELWGQLAGCAALVSTGKVLQRLLPEEHEPEFHHEWQPKKAEGEVDLYRDTWVRYFGYFNEVGEAMRPVIPVAAVLLSYVVAFAYIGMDSYSQGSKVLGGPKRDQWGVPALAATVDSLLFQGLASVVFPSFTINRWVTVSSLLVHDLHDQVPASVVSLVDYLPTLTGLVLIPLICSPLDTLTHKLLDVTYRPATTAVTGMLSSALASSSSSTPSTNSSPPSSSYNTTRSLIDR